MTGYPFRQAEEYYEQLKAMIRGALRRVQLAERPFQNEASVCSCVVYCQCPKHQSLAVLFVKCDKKSQQGRYVLPGGKRDVAGREGRVKYMKQNETCWQAMKGEFAEEVGENIVNYCPMPCPFTNINVQRAENVSYCVRLYYFQVDCSKLPSREYGRFRLHEATERRWVPLEDIVQQFKNQYKEDKQKMTLSPQMFVTFRQFANILANQLRLKPTEDPQQRVRVFKTIKLLEMLQNHSYGVQSPQQLQLIPASGHTEFAIYQ